MEKINDGIVSINKTEAEVFYKKYEHLGNCGLGVWHYGYYVDGVLLSVVSFGTANFNPKRSFIGKIAAAHNVKIIQLTRGGTLYDAPSNTPSKVIALVLKAIMKRFGNTIIIAYSDTKFYEVGTIYQASNFLYLGCTNPKNQSNYIVNGKQYTGWTIRKKYGTRNMSTLVNELELNIKKITLSEKHQYVYINTSPLIKKSIKNCLNYKIKAYPKRDVLQIGSMLDYHKSIGLRKN
ncbi:MAG: hypothetical protein FWF92_00460 [Oscillospiraceae bacterium]|nr:hypothetical protein [Oscillospiraceae bacterium]